MTKTTLFCFPYAGGSATIFHKWKQYLHPGIELAPVELAGRGKRMQEAHYRDIAEAVDDIFVRVKDRISQSPYALFGHSLGSSICYELADKIRRQGLPAPKHLFFSGWSAPHARREKEKKYHLMNDYDFRREVLELGGTPPEFFEHAELLQIFLPLLKNDFRLSETLEYSGTADPFEESITVFLGKDDELTAEQCDGWKRYSKGLCSIHYFEGGHFFLLDETEQIVNIINNNLLKS
jgi:medium-chain acyl-[acyl-carrier-protein] hydrolase